MRMHTNTTLGIGESYVPVNAGITVDLTNLYRYPRVIDYCPILIGTLDINNQDGEPANVAIQTRYVEFDNLTSLEEIAQVQDMLDQIAKSKYVLFLKGIPNRLNENISVFVLPGENIDKLFSDKILVLKRTLLSDYIKKIVEQDNLTEIIYMKNYYMPKKYNPHTDMYEDIPQEDTRTMLSADCGIKFWM